MKKASNVIEDIVYVIILMFIAFNILRAIPFAIDIIVITFTFIFSNLHITVPAILTIIGLNIKRQMNERDYNPILSLGFMATEQSFDKIEPVYKAIKSPFYQKPHEDRIEEIYKRLEIRSENLNNGSMFMHYDITSKHKVCEIILAHDPKESNNESPLTYKVESLYAVASFDNITVPINSIFIKDLTVSYIDSELRDMKYININCEVKFNNTIKPEERFYLLITERYLDKKYLLCDKNNKYQPNYKKIHMTTSVRSVYNEEFEYSGTFKFNGVSADCNLEMITPPEFKIIKYFGFRYKGIK